MRFLLVNHEYPPVGAGAATASEALAQHLSLLGHKITVLTARYAKLPGFRMESAVSVRRVRCIRKYPDHSNLVEMFAFMIAALVQMPFILKKNRSDGLIVFFSLPSGLIGLVAKTIFRIPYVLSLRGGDVPGFVPELNLLHKIIAPIRRLVLRNACAIVANSESLKKLSEKADRYPARVIPNGVDAKFFRPPPGKLISATSGDLLRILSVGRFHHQKNLAFLFNQLACNPPGSFRLLLVGDGPERNPLRELAARLGIAELITWYGWAPRSELPHLYQSADCLVIPSFYEGMANVILEAMACGLPVVASNVASNDAVVVHGETGFLFDPNVPDELPSILKQLRDADLRSYLGERARDRVLRLFSWQHTALEYAKLFKR